MPNGRPLKLTPEIQAKLVDAVGAGAYYEIAAPYAGIHKDTLYEWLKRGATGEQPYADFSDALKAAEAFAVVEDLKAIRDAQGGPGSAPWQNRAWRIERRHPRLYGRTVQEVQDGGAAPLAELPDIDLERTVAEANKVIELRRAKRR